METGESETERAQKCGIGGIRSTAARPRFGHPPHRSLTLTNGERKTVRGNAVHHRQHGKFNSLFSWNVCLILMEAGWGARTRRPIRPLQRRFVLVRPEGVRYAARPPLPDAARSR